MRIWYKLGVTFIKTFPLCEWFRNRIYENLCLFDEIGNTALILIMYANDYHFLSNDSGRASFTRYDCLWQFIPRCNIKVNVDKNKIAVCRNVIGCLLTLLKPSWLCLSINTMSSLFNTCTCTCLLVSWETLGVKPSK